MTAAPIVVIMYFKHTSVLILFLSVRINFVTSHCPQFFVGGWFLVGLHIHMCNFYFYKVENIENFIIIIVYYVRGNRDFIPSQVTVIFEDFVCYAVVLNKKCQSSYLSYLT